MDKVLALEEDARLAAELMDLGDGRWSTQVVTQEVCEFLLERLVRHCIHEGFFELVQCGNERFWDKLSAELSKIRRK